MHVALEVLLRAWRAPVGEDGEDGRLGRGVALARQPVLARLVVLLLVAGAGGAARGARGPW